MPARIRQSKNLNGPPTAQEMNSLLIGNPVVCVAIYGSLEAARIEWHRRKSAFPAHSDPPEGWWLFEGPAHLQEPTAPLDWAENFDAFLVELDALEVARRQWFAEHGPEDWQAHG